MTPAAAKAAVWEHWEDLRRFCQQRFRDKSVLAEEALNYVLDALATDEWGRVRAWRGPGTLLTFLLVMARRLTTDFERQKYGHVREPKWLHEKSDPVWHAAYRLLIVQQYAVHEAVEILMSDASRERGFVDEVVRTVQARCNRLSVRETSSQAINPDDDALPARGPSPLEELIEKEEDRLAAVLSEFVAGGSAAHLDDDVRELLARLKPYLELSAEDCMFLKLHCDGIKMSVIAQLLHLRGDPYKRLRRLLHKIERACKEAGIL